MVTIGGVDVSVWKFVVASMLGGYAIVANDQRTDLAQLKRESVEMQTIDVRHDSQFLDVQRQLNQQYEVQVTHTAMLTSIQSGVRQVDTSVTAGNGTNDEVLRELRALRQQVNENQESISRIYRHLSPMKR